MENIMIILVILLASSLSEAKTCRCLSLEGGGSHGSYEAGVIWALANLSNPEDITWNTVSGISAGAINTGAVVQFPMGQEIPMSNFLVNTWLSLNGSSSIYIDWEGGIVDGLLFHSGIYNTAPFYNFLRSNYLYGIHRNFTVGSTNLDTGHFGNFNETLGAGSVDSVMCSASPPFVFPPHEFEGYTWADGGCIMNLDIFSAVERCLDVTSEENIIADIIFDLYYTGLDKETKFKTLDVFERSFRIRSYDSSIWFYYNAKAAYPKVNYRYIIRPSDPKVQEMGWLNFSKPVIEYQIQLGINDTKAIFNSGKTGSTIISELYEENRNKIIYP